MSARLPKLSRMGSTLMIIGILAVFPIFLIVQYASAQSSDCYTRFLFAWHTVNPVLDCMEERLDAGGGGSHALDDLTDVVITTPLVTQVVKYNGTAWVNGADLLGLGNPHTLLNSTSHTDTVTSSVTRGDLVYGNSTPAWDDLAIGGASKYLRSDGTDISWQYPIITTYTADSTASINDDIIICNQSSGTITITLPTVSGNSGKYYKIVNIATADKDCIVNPNGNELINSSLTHTIKYTLGSIEIITDGNEWHMIGHSFNEFFEADYDRGVSVTTTATSGDIIVANDSSPSVWDDLARGTNGQVLTVDTTASPDLKWSTLPTIGFSIGKVFVSKTMTNIGTTNVDIYTTAFDEEDMMMIDCTNITDFRIVWMWDYVGTGTQTVRWVDASNNSNILYSTTTLVDADAIDSGWFTKPAFCSGIKTFEMQGSSTTAGDDPIAKGYVIYAR